jgi:hypothetical protein
MMKLSQAKCLAVLFVMVCLPLKEIVAQGGCFEIKSILVDACGTPEGENEMVRFDVGAAPMNVSGFVVDWPSGSWQGLCQNAATAGIVSSINGLIQGCGSVTEPVGGVLPANSKVLLLTSLNINTILNSFANLNEDLIVLFQCNGNTSGHFANYNTSPGLRTLKIEFTGSGGCIDSVTYDRTLLVNQFGVIGGFSSENDGAFVDFNVAGSPTYLNFGCQVLSTALALSAGPDVGICPGAAPVATLTGAAVNLIGNPQWAGGTGTFNPNNSLSTVYTPGAGDTGIVVLTVSGSGACNTSITDTVLVNIVTSLPVVTISASIDGTFSSNVTDPGYFYNWYPDGSSTYIAGAYAPEFTPAANGCYYMTLSTIGGCSVQSNTICITNVGLADITGEPFIALIGNPGIAPWIILETPVPAEKLNLEIIDIYGRQVRVMEFQNSGNHLEIIPDWSDIACGIYIIRLSGSNWSLENKAILTQ